MTCEDVDRNIVESILRGLADIKEGRYERFDKEKFRKDSIEKARARQAER